MYWVNMVYGCETNDSHIIRERRGELRIVHYKNLEVHTKRYTVECG